MKNNVPIVPNSNLQPLLRKVIPTPIMEVLEKVILPCRQTVKGTQNHLNIPHSLSKNTTTSAIMKSLQVNVFHLPNSWQPPSTQPYLLHNIDFMFRSIPDNTKNLEWEQVVPSLLGTILGNANYIISVLVSTNREDGTLE
jgi:hypothetical protein